MMRHWGQVFAFLAALSAWAQPPLPPAATAGYRISGTVVDAASGTPLAKTTVAIARVADNRPMVASMITAADGSFQFQKLAPGKYSLTAQRRGYPMQALDQHEGFATAVAVGPGLTSEDIVFRLRPDASLSGRVMDDANEPVRNAQVMLFRTDTDAGRGAPRQLAGNSTNDLGEYRFPHLQPGTYLLAVAAQPWYAQPPYGRTNRRGPDASPETEAPPPSPLDVAYPLTFYPAATEASAATPIILGSGEHVTADLALHPVPALRLRVQLPPNPDAPPGQSPGFNVNLRKRVFGAEVYVPVSVAGTTQGTEILGLAPGHYELAAQSNDRQHPMESRQEIDVAADSDIDGAQNAVVPVAVSGTLQLEGPKPASASQFQVMLRELQTNRSWGAAVSPDGQFEFQEKLAPGRYEIQIGGSLPVYLKAAATAGGVRVTARRLEIGGEAVKLNLIAGQGVGTVDGIALRDGKPRAGAMVVLVTENPAGDGELFRRDQSDSDGTFTLGAVVPGKYVVIAIDNWDVAWQNPEVLRRYLPRGQPVQVDAGGKYKVQVEVQ